MSHGRWKNNPSPVWNLSKEQFKNLCERSTSLSEIARGSGLAMKGANINTVKRRIAAEHIDVSHIQLGKKANLGRKFSAYSNRVPTEQLLVKNSLFPRKQIKTRIIHDNLIPYLCSICGLGKSWKDKELTLVLDHINGIANDHRLENLRFLCPNCNSQTDTFCGRNRPYYLTTRTAGVLDEET